MHPPTTRSAKRTPTVRSLARALLACVALAGGCAAHARDGTPGKAPVYAWEMQFRSEYLALIGLVLYDDPLMVHDISVTYGDVYLGTWISTGLGSASYGTTFADEFDLYGGWGHTYDWVRVQLTGAIFALHELERTNDDVWVIDSHVGFPKVPWVQPYLTVRWSGEVGAKSPERGWFVWPGIRREQPLGFRLGRGEAKLNATLSSQYADGAFSKDAGWTFTRVELALPVAIAHGLTLTPSIVYQTPVAGGSHPYTTRDEWDARVALRWIF